VLDGAEAGGYPGFADGYGLAVAAAVGVFGEGLAVALDFADVGFAFVGVGGDGEHDGVGRGGVEDEGDGLGFGVAAGQGDGPGVVDLWPCPLSSAVAGTVVKVFEHGVGAVDLVAGGGEVVADGADVGAAGDAVLQEAADFGLVGVPERAWMRSWVLRVWLMAPVWTKRTRPCAKAGDWGRAASQMASRRAVRWSTALPWASAVAMPSSMSRS
jgi:hypothetical protein